MARAATHTALNPSISLSRRRAKEKHVSIIVAPHWYAKSIVCCTIQGTISGLCQNCAGLEAFGRSDGALKGRRRAEDADVKGGNT